MGGSPSKRSRPSYEDGKVRDPEIEWLQRDAAEAGDDQRGGLVNLIKKAVGSGDRAARPARRSA